MLGRHVPSDSGLEVNDRRPTVDPPPVKAAIVDFYIDVLSGAVDGAKSFVPMRDRVAQRTKAKGQVKDRIQIRERECVEVRRVQFHEHEDGDKQPEVHYRVVACEAHH